METVVIPKDSIQDLIRSAKLIVMRSKLESIPMNKIFIEDLEKQIDKLVCVMMCKENDDDRQIQASLF